jgi:hypothetical protein
MQDIETFRQSSANKISEDEDDSLLGYNAGAISQKATIFNY